MGVRWKNKFLLSIAISILSYSIPVGAYCPPDRPLPLFTACLSCDEPDAIILTSELRYNDFTGKVEEILPEQMCPNRQIVKTGRTFHNVLKNCPPEKPLRTALGGCYNCDSANEILIKAGSNTCSNRVVRKTGSPKEELTFLKCPADKPLQARSFCYACDDKTAVLIHPDDKEDILKACSNRKIVQHYSYQYSVFEQYDGVTNDEEAFSCNDKEKDIYIATAGSKMRYSSFYKNPCANRELIVQGKNMFLRLIEDKIPEKTVQNETSAIPEILNEIEIKSVQIEENTPKIIAKISSVFDETEKQEEIEDRAQTEETPVILNNHLLKVSSDCTSLDYETGWCSLCQSTFFPQKEGVFLNRTAEDGSCVSCASSQEIFLKDDESVRLMKKICPHRLTYQYGTYGKFSVPDLEKWKRKYIFCGWGLFCKPEQSIEKIK